MSDVVDTLGNILPQNDKFHDVGSKKLPIIDPIEMIRMVATTRILMPFSRVRLSAGREQLSREAQILCLQAGADSIFYGDTLLTTSNPEIEAAS